MTLAHKWLVLTICLLMIALPFTLLAQTTTPPTATPRVALYGSLNYGDYVTGSVNEDVPAAIYTFEGKAGDRMTITLNSDDFDAYLALRDAAQRVLVTDEDSAGGTSARIEGYVLPANATYIIRAGAFGGGAKGAYELRLEQTKRTNGCGNRSGHGY